MLFSFGFDRYNKAIGMILKQKNERRHAHENQ